MISQLTDREIEVHEAYQRLASKQGVADELGLSRSTVRAALDRVAKKKGMRVISPIPVPDGLHMPKTTVQYSLNKDTGELEVVNEWRRMTPHQRAIEEWVERLAAGVEGKGVVPVCTTSTGTDMLLELDIFDPHVGMYASERYTLEKDYNCNTAARAMVYAAQDLLARANNPEKVVVVFGGDLQHMDNRSNRTEKSGNILDVDTRYQRVVEYLTQATTTVVQLAAETAPEVEVVITPGNHDWHSCVWLASVLEAYYRNCPNVLINRQRSPRKSMQWGDNALFWTHGDSVKANKWGNIIPAEFPQLWGATKYRHLKLGHVHHKKTVAPVVIDEQAGLVVEWLEALCPVDAWHVDAGFVGSQRGASAFEYHRSNGLATRFYHASPKVLPDCV